MLRLVVEFKSSSETNSSVDIVAGDSFHTTHERAGTVRTDFRQSQRRKPGNKFRYT